MALDMNHIREELAADPYSPMVAAIDPKTGRTVAMRATDYDTLTSTTPVFPLI